MLSLKSTPTNHVVISQTSLLDLPQELLRSIIDHVDSLNDIFSTSLVSKRLRDAVLPILYRSINLTFTTRIQRYGETILDFLSNKPHLQKHVRQVTVREPPLDFEVQELEFLKFQRLSTKLENILQVRICTFDDVAVRMLELPYVRKEAVRMNIIVPHYKHQCYLERLRDFKAVALTFRFHYASLPPWFNPRDPCLLRPAGLASIIGRFCALRSLSVIVEPGANVKMMPRLQNSCVSLDADSALPALQELHLEFPSKECSQMDEAVDVFLAIIPWAQLQRLSLTGTALIEEVLHTVRTSLSSLTSLRLKAMNLLPVWLKHRLPLDGLFRNPGLWFAGMKAVSEAWLLLEGHPLEEVMLDGFPVDPLFPRILCPKLRKLKIHMCELLPVPSGVKLLQAADLHTLARQAPNLDHLEIDIGRIGNLWHSTAVPGVDVDVRIYQVLDAITMLPHLKVLRLFPRYRQPANTSVFESTLTQPLTDDAAVRLFRKLKEKSASLETLVISSDNHIAQCIIDFDPMSWELRAAGEKVILIARQANHSYEQRQIWVGERRLTMEIRRFSYQQPYIPEFEGWIMQC